ncbi:MAG: hypothetical protein ACRDJU_12590 [Actinomycetota bacterium]
MSLDPAGPIRPRPPREALWMDREMARAIFGCAEPSVACSDCGATHVGRDHLGNRHTRCRGCQIAANPPRTPAGLRPPDPAAEPHQPAALPRDPDRDFGR